MKTIGIIMTYNCGSMVKTAYNAIPKKYLSDVILVDDGSTDDTVAQAKRLGIKVFAHTHMGYGGNIKYGLQKALQLGADCMIEIHGDGQYDLRAIPAALKKIQSGYDFVLGSRFIDKKQPLADNMSFARFFANVGLSFFDRLILQVPLTEFHTGFRVYSKHLLKKVGFSHSSHDYLYSFEIIAQAKYHDCTITEVPVRCFYDKAHTSVSLKKATLYSFQTFFTLALYLLAKGGIYSKLFPKKKIRRK